MLSDDLRRRLELLNRWRLPAPPQPTSNPRVQPSPNSVCIDDLGPACVCPTPAGDCYTISRHLSDFWSDAPVVAREYNRALRQFTDDPAAPTPTNDLRTLISTPASSAIFFDVETCGFAPSPIFLIGLMQVDDADLSFEILLARDYAEEPAILSRFLDRLAAAHILISFNGKSFDLPLVRERLAVSRLPLPYEIPHLDILHSARRAWKSSLPDCRLQTLEAYVLARTRRNDIPSSHIPAAYHDFVLTGNARLLADIIHHNLLDLTTMAQLLPRLLSAKRPRVP
jgi:uncharacterized protein YprB with RNaseH-like and TPR domain